MSTSICDKNALKRVSLSLGWLLAAMLTATQGLHARPLPLRNPGFEAVAANGVGLPGWALSEWTGGKSDILAERVPEGHQSESAARVTWRSGGGNILLHQAVALRGQHRCRLSFHFKTDVRTGVSCSIRALKDGRALQYNSSQKTEAAGEWTKHVFEFTTHPECEQLVVYLRQDAGTAWFDDISLETIAPPKPLDWRPPEAVAAWKRFAPSTVRLNNLVIRLLETDVDPVAAKDSTSYTFATPRNGWVRIAAKLAGNSATGLQIRIDTGDTHALWRHHRAPEGSLETMLHMSAGDHVLHVLPAKGARLAHLDIRSIPELICCEYESAASGREHLMKRHPHLLDDYNVTLENFYRHHQDNVMRTETIDPASQVRLEAWIARGGRALTHSTIPGLNAGPSVKLDQAFEFWTHALGLQRFQGIMCDEFSRETPEQLAVYAAAIEKMAADPRFAGKTFYAYGPASWGAGAANRAFRKTLFRHGHKQALEMYLREQPDEDAARREIDHLLTQWVGSANLDMPGSVARTILVLCCCSKNYYGMDCFASVDYRVFLDMQFHLMATNPMFKDLGGISAWILRSADDEIIDWLGRLHRHYAIEGRTDRLSDVCGLSYRLPHLVNPDFVDGLRGWRAEPVEPGGIEARLEPGFGLARGTMLPAPVGDSVVVLKRTGQRANRLTQTLRELIPGALYTVRLYSGDADGLENGASKNREHAISLALAGGELLPEHTARDVYDHAYGGRSHRASRTWFNRHIWVFRAAGTSAELSIHDVPDDATGALKPQTLLVNFVEVRRLLEETP
ncbi:MAG: hypothetical protein KAI66_03980 [Lentisphaeria bacterium]|nr:hypothetical protein [Lentisphaeria bacterium]